MSTKKKPTQLDRIEHRLALVEISLDVLRSGATFMQELDRAKAAPIDQSHLVNMLEKEIDSFIMMPGGTRWFMERMPKDLVSKNPRLCDAIVEYVTTLEGKRAAPQPEGLQPGDYTDASKEVADALTAMGWAWWDGDRGTYPFVRRSVTTDNEMINVTGPAHRVTYLPPATFLRRAAVTAKEIGLVPVEPWVPTIGQWIKFKNGSWQTKEYNGIAKVKSGPDEEGHYLTEDVSAEPFGYYFEVSEARPATEAEIAAHLAEQEAKKPVVFGTRVEYEDDKGWKIAIDVPSPDGTWIIVKQGHARIAWVKRSDFTVID